MKKYTVRLKFLETYHFEDIEAESESEAEEVAFSMLSDAYAADNEYYDNEIELIEGEDDE